MKSGREESFMSWNFQLGTSKLEAAEFQNLESKF